MSDWNHVADEVPDLAAAVQERFLAHRHATMATLRRDGSPRLCGTELSFRAGQLWLAAMAGTRRLADLRRDARVALHSASEDPPGWRADARISGTAVEMTDPSELAAFAGGRPEQPPGAFGLFRVEPTELVLVRLGEPPDHLVVESWQRERGYARAVRS